jgi:hypothetical protein
VVCRSGYYLASGYGHIYTYDPQIYIHMKQDILMFHLYANKIYMQILVDTWQYGKKFVF